MADLAGADRAGADRAGADRAGADRAGADRAGADPAGADPAGADLAGALPSPSVWAGRRVLLTGHTGFKGGWLAVWLDRLGASVTGLSLAAEPDSLGEALGIEQRLPSIRADIRDAERLRQAVVEAKPDVVFHLAAQPLVRRSYADPLETLQTNVLGTAHVLEAVRATPSVRAVVVVTTDKCYENREWVWPYRENDPLGGHDPYSSSKAGAELVTASWRQSFLAAQGVAVASARAGNVVGGGDWSADRLVPDCLRAFGEGRSVRIRNPAATRPWQHVLDPLCGYLVLAERLLVDAEAARAWNFGPGPDEVRPVADVVRLVAEAWGGGADWSADPGDHPHEAGLLALDSSLARLRLGWRPRLPLAAALRQTVAWYKRRRAGADPYGLVLAEIEAYATGAPP
jgi:CDP-glucose 4,6-dehydratase